MDFQLVQKHPQSGRVCGLDQVLVETSIFGPLPVFGLTPASQRHQPHGSAACGARTQAARKLEAGHHRHAQVEQRKLRWPMTGGGKRCRAVIRDFDRRTHHFEQQRQTVSSVAVVVNNKHPGAQRLSGFARRGQRGCLRRLRCVFQRQAQREFAAAAQSVAVHKDAAAMHLDQAFGQAQPDAQTALPTRARVIDLHKGLEHLGVHFRRNADRVMCSIWRRIIDLTLPVESFAFNSSS